MSSFYQKVKENLKTTTQKREASKKSVSWLRNFFKKELRSGKPKKTQIKRNELIGSFFIYVYDPKFKEELPWYDKLPVTIPVSIYNDGFLGLNVHYLPPQLRGRLMDGLIRIRDKSNGDMDKYSRMSYEALSSTLNSSLVSPCVKRYLTNHIRSKLIRIEETEWEKVAMLPIQQFEKATSGEVWRSIR